MDEIGHLTNEALAIIGPILIVYSVFSFFHTRFFVKHCADAEGEVIRLERSFSGGQAPMYDYVPVFQFTAANGQSYTVTSATGSNPPGFSVGEQVSVRYDPRNPSDARIHTFLQTWGSSLISGLIGIGFLAFGLQSLGLLPALH